MDSIAPETLSKYTDKAIDMALNYGPQLLLAIVVLVVGLWLINRIVATIGRTLSGRAVEPTLGRFLTSLTGVTFKALLLISVASMVGIETTSFIAILGAAGLAVGLALQGSLANFAGGVLVLLFRPYKVGDFIEGQGVSGTVAAIQIFSTVIKTGDNKVIIVPNGALSNGIITNYSTEATRRVDLVFGIDYGDDIVAAKGQVEKVLGQDDRVLTEPGPAIMVSSLGDNAVNITVRAWVKAADYWPVYFATTERVKLAFDAAGISFPFPQRTVHLKRTD
jgi:small conductance mechanosensitive channel